MQANPSIHLAIITILMWNQAMCDTLIKWKCVYLAEGKKATAYYISQDRNARDRVFIGWSSRHMHTHSHMQAFECNQLKS